MKLTREECLEALDYILNKKVVVLTMKGERILKQLINEHFDNPPLKFEELHENMWVWDNEYKHFIKIRRVRNKNSFTGYYPNFEIDPFTDEKYEDLQSIFFFEDNRYYRKQVK